MKILSVVAGITLLASIQAGAETYSWIDEQGTYNFTEDLSSVPKKYREKVTTRDGIEGIDTTAPNASDTIPSQPSAVPTAKDAESEPELVPSQQSDGLYGGKKPEAWQAEMGPVFAELKRLEVELEVLGKRINNPRGVSREELAVLMPQFKEAQKRYREALKNYKDLNDAANKAGLPAAYRK